MISECKCCEISTMCGYSLHHGVKIVGTVSALISIICLAEGAAYVVTGSEEEYNNKPVRAINLIFGLYMMSVSLYQIAISLLLVWQAVRTAKGDKFICTLWYVSHLSVLTLYTFLFTAKVVVCFVAKQYFLGVVTAVFGALYLIVFIYFSIVVNSFSSKMDEQIYY